MSVFLRPHNDEPVAELDCLPERVSLVNHIAESVAQCDPPHVFGIHGEWGAGKTSFLCALEKRITGGCRKATTVTNSSVENRFKHISVVWFEAWRYQHEASPVIALLHELCAQLPLGSRTTTELKKLAYAGFRGLIDSVKEVTVDPMSMGLQGGGLKINNPLAAIIQAGESYEKSNYLTPLTTETIRAAIDNAIRALLGPKKNARVLIIVDDLDRCEATAAYRLLEGIKIYLNIPSCVFVLGINQRHINRGLGDALGLSGKPGEAEKRGSEYLEKLCSVIWKLPISNSTNLTMLAQRWLCPKTPDGKLVDDYRLPSKTVDLMVALQKSFDFLPRNPRKLKAFCNTFRHLAGQNCNSPHEPGGELEISTDDTDALIVAASIYTFHPELLGYLQASPSFFDSLLVFSLLGIDSLDQSSSSVWMANHEAFKLLLLPGRNANRSRIDWDEHPGPDEGHVFRIQSLLNHATGQTEIVALPEEYTAEKNRGAFYERLQSYLFLQNIETIV